MGNELGFKASLISPSSSFLVPFIMLVHPIMDILLQWQRLHHIVNSYSLAGEELETFSPKLDLLVKDYPWFLIELALVEVLSQNWLRYPMPRGLLFLEQVQRCLQKWQEAAIVSSWVTPDQFEQITGLTPRGFEMLKTPAGKSFSLGERACDGNQHRQQEGLTPTELRIQNFNSN
ncbi:MAG: hypothetical protein F6K42_01445 [Leptolyngbya sp. SIO1D8]|nr:hypothetical protein [Leptolyngbya sp. SIO1D8]